jgi:hypothetical protein
MAGSGSRANIGENGLFLSIFLSILNNDAEMQHGEPAATTLRQLQTTKLETVEIQF